ncbi:MAG: tripartite tricarboxylate transporter TctB family protein [Candidatus Binatia bacterium]
MRKRSDLIIGVLLLVFCAVVFYETFGLTSHFLLPIGPSFLPRVWLALLGFFGLLLVIGELRTGRSSVSDNQTERAEEREVARLVKQWFNHYRLVIYSLGTFLAYILSLYVLGFLLSTVLFLALLQWILSPRQLKQLPLLLLISVISASVIYWIFQEYLHVFLPEGLLFQ